MDFDFSTLNSSDLEALVCDLWNAEEAKSHSGITFKIFAAGKDTGIDLLYATAQNPYAIVGQVKHYYKSGYSRLLKDLREKETDKVIKLQPGSYRFATSLDLTVKQTEEIFRLFEPYMESAQAIYAKKDLNRLLNEFPQLIDQHFKLWFSNTTVLQKILHYPVLSRSEDFAGEQLKRKLRLYVKTPLFDEALRLLKERNILIITGEPGVGKTTLAELLSYELIRQNFSFTYIYDNVKEIESVLRQDDSKQLFYYDDFLGHNALEISKAKSTESALLNILARIKRSKNKKLILTTRNFILAAALDESEKLRAAGLRLLESVVKLDEYDRDMRLQLFLNHIEESDLAQPYKDFLLYPPVYLFLIHHPNFYPRSIEYITTAANVGYIELGDFVNFVYGNFNKPDAIWRHAYERQIQDTDRMFLNTLLSFGDMTEPYLLEAAFHARLAYEAAHHNFTYPMQAFQHSFKRLAGGFIGMNDYKEDHETTFTTYINFVNYSLVDFLVGYLKEDKQEVVRIAESALYAEQLIKRLFKLDENIPETRVPERLKTRLLLQSDSFIRNNSDTDRATVALILLKYLNEPEARELASQHLLKITDWSNISNEFGILNYLKELILDSSDPELITLIKSLGVKVFAPVLYWIYNLDEIFHFQAILLEEYQLNIRELFRQDDQYDWNRRFTMILDNQIELLIDQMKETSYNEDALEKARRDIMDLKQNVNSLGLSVTPDFEKFNDYQLENTDQ